MGRAAQRVAGTVGVALALAALAGCRSEAKETKMAEPGEKTERAYVGRISIALPVGMARSDVEYKMQLLTLREEPLAPPFAEAARARWAGKLASIDALKAGRRRPHHLVGEIVAQRVLEGRFGYVSYHNDNAKLSGTHVGFQEAGPVGLWMQRPGGFDKQQAIQSAMQKVGRAYQPRPEDGPPLEKEPNGFHLAGGAVLLPFEEQESAGAIFKGGPHGAEVEIDTATVVKVDRKGLFERFSESVITAGAAFSAGVSTVRSGKKEAGGFAGEELVLRDSEKGKLAFIWRFSGESGSGTRPEITLQMSSPGEPRQEVMARWDALVASLRPAAEGAGR